GSLAPTSPLTHNGYVVSYTLGPSQARAGRARSWWNMSAMHRPVRALVPLALITLVAGFTAAMRGGPISHQEGVAPPRSFTTEQWSHWAYQPLKPAEPPGIRQSSWVRNPIDLFILAALEELEWTHAPEASRVALIRRATYDLTGLPPTPGEVIAFLRD